MNFLSSLALVLSTAGFVAAGPFTIRYYSQYNCESSALSCINVNEFDCCNAPSDPSSYPTVRVTSSGGPADIVVFATPNTDGTCGPCTNTGLFNNCYDNHTPFETVYVASSTICNPDDAPKLKRDGLTLFKQPVTNASALTSAPSECRRIVPIDTATVNGYDYDLTGPDRETIMADLKAGINLDVFDAKWANVRRGPATA